MSFAYESLSYGYKDVFDVSLAVTPWSRGMSLALHVEDQRFKSQSWSEAGRLFH